VPFNPFTSFLLKVRDSTFELMTWQIEASLFPLGNPGRFNTLTSKGNLSTKDKRAADTAKDRGRNKLVKITKDFGLCSRRVEVCILYVCGL
jgi:hypothetical protein